MEFDKFLLRELLEICKQLDIENVSGKKKSELITLIEEYFKNSDDFTIASGKLDIMADGYGFLRDTTVEGKKDIYISLSQIKKFKLRPQDIIIGVVRKPKDDEKNYALRKVLFVNNESTDKAEARVPFEELVPYYPTEKLTLETNSSNISGRIIDLIAPIGKGQRGLIVAPPKAGKTILISTIANSIIENYKDIDVWILLIDERPEEVTDIRENVKGAEVFYSTFDEDPKNHIKVTEEIIERAKIKVENGEDVVILMDSLTRLARAYNIVIPSSGKLISGGIDPSALYYPKNFFGTARNIKNGGSLTIIATALIDTGSKMDDIIYEEFKGTGNMEIHLDRSLAELRIYPAIDIQKSGTRKEELLIEKEKLPVIWNFRRYLSSLDKASSTKYLINELKKTKSNEEMIERYKKSFDEKENKF